MVDEERHLHHLCRILGSNLMLAQITRAHIVQFKQIRKTETHRGKPISETTINRSLEVLRHMLRIAEEEGVIESAPRRLENCVQWACRQARLQDLHFHDLRHTFVTRKVREGWDYKRIMAITSHKTFIVFQRYNNPAEVDIKEMVLADPP